MTVTVKSTKVKEEDTARLWWRIVRGTWRGSRVLIRNAYIDGRVFYGQSKTKIRAHYHAWKREREFSPDELDFVEPDEVPHRRRRLFRSQFLCFACQRKFKSAYGLNKHLTGTHGGESPPKRRDMGGVSTILGRDGTEKVLIRTSVAQSGVGRATTTNARSANPMNSAAAQALKAAWGRLKESRPTKLSEIRDDMIGVEQALGAFAGEAVEAYRAHLIRLGFDPVTVQNLVRVVDDLANAGKRFSAVIAIIEEAYAADIAAAKKRAGGSAPSDKTLAN